MNGIKIPTKTFLDSHHTTVGYFNYRYFCNFLLYVSCGMMYGAIITFKYFLLLDSQEFHHQIMLSRNMYFNDHKNNLTPSNHNSTIDEFPSQHQQQHQHPPHKGPSFKLSQVQHVLPNIPTPSERMPICFSFMMCLAVGIAVSGLFAFHLYLVFTSQTTIEFHGNMYKRRTAKENGYVWSNPYNLGWKRNIEQIWGKIEVSSSPRTSAQEYNRMRGKLSLFVYRLRQIGAFGLLLLPSWREPEFLPIPMKDDFGRRKSNGYSHVSSNATHDDNIV